MSAISSRNIFLSFQGIGFSSGARRRFDVICGANPPTITDGYATWQTIARPLQRGLTVLQGYDPAQMTLDVIFAQFVDEGWQQGDPAGHAVENAIGDLEWMAGANFVAGPSPVVYVFSHRGTAGDSDLIPSQYRGMPWIITSLQWGTAYRNQKGFRIWQEATITLENYLNLNTPPAADTNVQGGYFRSTAGRDSAWTIASAPSTISPTVDHATLARNILASSKNNPVRGSSINLQRRSVYWPIRHGLQVWVPAHQSL